MRKGSMAEKYYLLLICGTTLLFVGIGWMLDMLWAGAAIGLGIGMLVVANKINPTESK